MDKYDSDFNQNIYYHHRSSTPLYQRCKRSVQDNVSSNDSSVSSYQTCYPQCYTFPYPHLPSSKCCEYLDDDDIEIQGSYVDITNNLLSSAAEMQTLKMKQEFIDEPLKKSIHICEDKNLCESCRNTTRYLLGPPYPTIDKTREYGIFSAPLDFLTNSPPVDIKFSNSTRIEPFGCRQLLYDFANPHDNLPPLEVFTEALISVLRTRSNFQKMFENIKKETKNGFGAYIDRHKLKLNEDVKITKWNQKNLRKLYAYCDNHVIYQQIMCTVCKENGLSADIYMSHTPFSPITGKATCQVLRSQMCPICLATGDEAHFPENCSMYYHN
ncbi:hypothetical protein PVAND_011659 [Polypedilum vanderplanki]|uniref:Nanos-type domain-containing protein n=1 Tax=Polypedilum vanderplanki TaxID=319348 RepID=A0A9J6CKV2_POLVA|nr:hypothetical protein PVAND_011659 [Polypedilum vanderplanki]